MRYILGLAAGCLILAAASAQPVSAAPPAAFQRPNVRPAYVQPNLYPVSRPSVNPQYNGTRPIGGDWWRTYPWSPYNAYQNPYWYPPYNNNYPYPPNQAYPYNPYPVPQPWPAPTPWGGIGSSGRQGRLLAAWGDRVTR